MYTSSYCVHYIPAHRAKVLEYYYYYYYSCNSVLFFIILIHSPGKAWDHHPQFLFRTHFSPVVYGIMEDDGWDDDLDELDIASDSGDNDDNGEVHENENENDDIDNTIELDKIAEAALASLTSIAPASSTPRGGTTTTTTTTTGVIESANGWNYYDEDNTNVGSDVFSPGLPSASTAVVGDGWNDDEMNLDDALVDDEDDLNFDNDDWGDNNNNNNNLNDNDDSNTIDNDNQACDVNEGGQESATIHTGMDNNFNTIHHKQEQQQQQQEEDQHQQQQCKQIEAYQPPLIKDPNNIRDKNDGNDDDDDDDDDLNFDDDDWGGTMDDSTEIGTTTPPPASLQDPSTEIGITSSQRNHLSAKSHPPIVPDTTTTTSTATINTTITRIVQELEDYITSLERIQSSINAILEFEYNTIEKANELVEYYSSRPQLADYTRKKELSRMNYQIILPNGDIETDKQTMIDHNLLPDESMLSRSANQSLLADLMQVLTGDDLIVRPQYLAGCVATWCQFTILMGRGGGGLAVSENDHHQHRYTNDYIDDYPNHDEMVTCQARLMLSLPTEKGDRIEVAEVAVSVVFAPGQPMVEYKVHKIDILLQDYQLLVSTAAFLSTMEGHLYDIPGHIEEVQLRHAPSDVFRDAFMENSQRFLSKSSQGMKSAWQQMDSVINIKQKIQAISNFIPDTDQIMLAAEQETVAFAEARRRDHKMMLQQQQQLLHQKAAHPQHVHGPMTIQNAAPLPSFPRPPPQAIEKHAQLPLGYNSSEQLQQQPRPRPPLPPPPRPTNDTTRPKSILGGLFQTLAKSVAIPDDDPAIYGAVAPPSQAQPPQYHHSMDGRSAGTLNRPSYQEPPPPLLYRKEEPVEAQMLLYRRQEKQHPPPSLEAEIARMAIAPRPPPPQQQQRQQENLIAPPSTAKHHAEQVPAQDSQQRNALLKIKDAHSKHALLSSNEVGNVTHCVVEEFQESRPSPSIAKDENQIIIEDEYHFENDSRIDFGRNSSHIVSLRQSNKPTVEEEREEIVDGWDDDGIDDLDDLDDDIDIALETPVTLGDSPVRVHQDDGGHESLCAVVDTVDIDHPGTILEMTYNPEDDIVETRKRWRNERPYRPYITG
jgi:hypothetical protein